MISLFRKKWIEQIKEHQDRLIPIDVVEKSKSWFEYIYNVESPERSTYRCRICHKYYDDFGLSNRYKSPLANTDGTLKSDKSENRRAIQDHPKKHGHLKVIEKLEERNCKR